MPDLLDEIQEREDHIHALRIAAARQAPAGPVATGYCLYVGCDEPLPAGHRWCGPECRDLWERGR